MGRSNGPAGTDRRTQRGIRGRVVRFPCMEFLRMSLALLFLASMGWGQGMPIDGIPGAYEGSSMTPLPARGERLGEGVSPSGSTPFDASGAMKSKLTGSKFSRAQFGYNTNGSIPSPSLRSSSPRERGEGFVEGQASEGGAPNRFLLPGGEKVPEGRMRDGASESSVWTT